MASRSTRTDHFELVLGSATSLDESRRSVTIDAFFDDFSLILDSDK